MLHTKQEVTDTEYYSKAADYWENVTPSINGMLGQQLVRAECVRCPWALLQNEVSTIFGTIFLSFLCHILFSQKGSHKKIRFGVKKIIGPPP